MMERLVLGRGQAGGWAADASHAASDDLAEVIGTAAWDALCALGLAREALIACEEQQAEFGFERGDSTVFAYLADGAWLLVTGAAEQELDWDSAVVAHCEVAS